MTKEPAVQQDVMVPAKELAALQEAAKELENRQKLGLYWRDIPEDVELQLASQVPVLTYEQKLDISGDPSGEYAHALIEGDNLHALYTLQATHKGLFDVIYIDPPYNTGREFIYNDKLVDRENNWRHSAWLSFMSKRLELARDLLNDSGLIFISIDDNEHARLRLLCDKIFGDSNVIGDLAVVNNLKGRSDDKYFATAHESLIVCAKDKDQVELAGFPLDEKQAAEYKYSDSKGAWKPVGLQKTGKNSDRKDRPNLFYPIYWNKKNNSLSLSRTSKADVEVLPRFTDGRDGTWRWGKETFSENAATELVVREQGRGPVIYVKMRLASEDGEQRTARPKSIWLNPKYDSGSATALLKQMLGGKIFDNPKPLEYIKDILRISTSEDSLILDFFAGTGTTLHAAAELNAEDGGSRHVVLVTNNEGGICRDVAHPRIKAALTGVWASGTQAPLPGALRFYRTDFIKRRSNVDRMRTEVAKRTQDLIALKEGAVSRAELSHSQAVLFGRGRTVAIISSFDLDHVLLEKEARSHVRDGDEQVAYLFTWSDTGIEGELVEKWSGWNVLPLPAQMLAELRKLAPERGLFDDDLFTGANE